MRLKTLAGCLLASTFSFSTITLACSNVAVTGPNDVVAVARTMDLEFNTGNTFGFGGRGWKNVSNINMPQKAPTHALKWTNKYPFLGQTGFKSYVIADGINNQGLYASFLDLPDVSYYPAYDPKDKRPELGITDLVNYVLGTAKSVPEAIADLMKTQIIANSFALKIGTKLMFGGNAVHLILRDKEGNAAVIEWTKVNDKPMLHVYEHKAGIDTVIESIPDSDIKSVTFKNADASVATNSPDYAWQLTNTARYDKVFTGNTSRKWDGLYMNGSGFYDIPGNWTPPGRFARATQLIRVMPKPENEQQAQMLAFSALETVRTPVGSNPAASLWASVSDLKHNIYHYKVLLNAFTNMKTETVYISLPKFDAKWQTYDVNTLGKRNKVPKGWIKAIVKQGPIATPAGVKMTEELIHAPTKGDMKATIKWMSARPTKKGMAK